MTKDAQEDVKVEDGVEDDVVDETDVAEMMKDAPKSEPEPPEAAPPSGTPPFRKLVICVTDAGLVDFPLNQLTILEIKTVGQRLVNEADVAIRQQAEAYKRSQEKRT